mmetsp:Transcript_1685/g.5915  ORF Transcript_1685/g.5915 Transcript_1685/m.5915 type:complete len:128 (-) Transcript_1685:486-869(-)
MSSTGTNTTRCHDCAARLFLYKHRSFSLHEYLIRATGTNIQGGISCGSIFLLPMVEGWERDGLVTSLFQDAPAHPSAPFAREAVIPLFSLFHFPWLNIEQRSIFRSQRGNFMSPITISCFRNFRGGI